MSPSRRSPRPISLALEHARGDWAPDTVLAQAQQIWPGVVGAAIAAEASPTRERGGVLTVSCSASVWAQELDLMGPMIVQRLNGVLGGDRVKRLRCVAVQGSRS
ncbi:MAG: DciA family protein [Solirubrobacteraceae bacterium]